jgi:hypothetical protein
VATHDDKHPEMLDEELRPLHMHLELYDFVHRKGEWAPDDETPAEPSRSKAPR